MDWILLGIPIGIVMLYFGSEWLVDGAKKLALRLGITPFVVGLTVVAFGSSAPEAITSIISSGTPEVIIGNIVGSNIANVGLAIGLAAIITPLISKYTKIRFEMIAMMAAVTVIAVLALTGSIGLFGGILLTFLLLVFVVAVYFLKKNSKEEATVNSEDVKEEPAQRSLMISVIMVATGLVILFFGARFFIDGAISLAGIMGISDMLVGLLVVAVGTSLPELCICLVAAYRKENELAISNIVGSIIFNSFFALGLGAIFVTVPISQSMMFFHIPVMIGMCLLMFLTVRFKGKVSRSTGIFLFVLYCAYIVTMWFVPSLTV